MSHSITAKVILSLIFSANSRPAVTVSALIVNATLYEELSLTVEVTDNDIDDTTTLFTEFTNVTNGENISSSANVTGNTFTWTPTSADAVELM